MNFELDPDFVMAIAGSSHETRRVQAAANEVVRVGRTDAVIVEAASWGVCVRHSGALRLGSELRLSFRIGSRQAAVVAVVISSRVVRLAGEGTLFDTTLRFAERSIDVQRWIERLTDATVFDPPPPPLHAAAALC
ncbi:MAG TPA: hypothetical protein VNL91_11665 [Thermoanaerobaculia bacterium]|nr:hypothetical protein [Thermoanaerobaculia bacterium]